MPELTRITETAAWTLRPAHSGDVEPIAAIWHAGWHDGHLGHVPEGLLAYRRPEQFLARAPRKLDDTIVATLDGQVLGFVMAVGDEIEQLYVAEAARGTGVAATLLRYGEHVIASRHFERAWLVAATGNARARRFYLREGWRDTGAVEARAHDGGGFLVACHRYEKVLAAPSD